MTVGAHGPHAQYTLYPQEYSYRYRLRPYSVKSENPVELSKQVIE